MPRDITPDEARDVDVAALRDFRDAMFLRHDDGEDIPLRVFNEKGAISAPVAKVRGSMEPIIEAARMALTCEGDGTFCPPLITSKNGWRAAEADIAGAGVVTTELDNDPDAMADRGIQLLGQPTAIVWSGGITNAGELKRHLHWRLMEVARTAEELRKVRRLRAMITLACKSDPTSIPPSHPIRWPGSWHRKAEPRLATVEINADAEIDLDASIAVMIEAGYDVPLEAERPDIAKNLLAPSEAALDAVMMNLRNSTDVDWNQWNTVGMALFNASGGSSFGCALFDLWSEACAAKYKRSEVMKRWRHWMDHPADRIGFPTLRQMAEGACIPLVEEARTKVVALKDYRAAMELAAELGVEEGGAEVTEAVYEPRELTDADIVSIKRMGAKVVALYPHIGAERAVQWCADAAAEGAPLWKAWELAINFKAALSELLGPPPEVVTLPAVEKKEMTEEERAADMEALKAEIAESASEDRFQAEQGSDEMLDRIPEGAFKNLCRYTYGRMMLDSPEMAVIATALATSAVTANNFVVTTSDEVNAGLNMFGIMLAPSGTTKSHVDDAMAAVLGAAGADDDVAEGIPSSQGLHGLFEDRLKESRCPGDGSGKKSPVVFVKEDEVSDFAERLTTGKGARTDSQQDTILRMMLKLFTRSQGRNSAILAARRASSRDSRPRINNPFLVFGGFAPPDDLMAALNESILGGGFGNRTLFALALEKIAVEKNIDRTVAITDGDVQVLRAMRAACHVPLGPKQGHGEFHRPGLVEWHRYKRAIRMSDAQASWVIQVERDLKEELSKAGLLPVLAQRVRENVMKLAGLISAAQMAQAAVMMDDACDMQRPPQRGWQDVPHVLQEDALEFAVWFVTRQVRQFARYCDSHLSGSNPIVKLADKLLEKMRAVLSDPAGAASRSRKVGKYLPHLKKGLIPKAMIGAVLMRSEGDATTVFKVIQTLEERGDITVEEGESEGGRTPTFYKLARR